MNRRSHRHRAFTLIELLLVMVILAVLAAVVIPNIAGYGDKAKRSGTIADISSFKSALGAFEVDCGRYPTDAEGLGALVSPPPGLEKDWKPGGYLDKIPNDKWGNAYVYHLDEATGKPTILSMGKDGQAGTDDDITVDTEK